MFMCIVLRKIPSESIGNNPIYKSPKDEDVQVYTHLGIYRIEMIKKLKKELNDFEEYFYQNEYTRPRVNSDVGYSFLYLSIF